MWVAQLKSIGQPLELTRIAIPRPGPGELLVKLEASGICHTDLHVIDGPDFPARAPQPLTLGQEGIGTVVEQGRTLSWLLEHALVCHGCMIHARNAVAAKRVGNHIALVNAPTDIP